MNTRRASAESPFRQERFMSSPEIERGLLANCVAARVQTLSDPHHRKLIWWLQKRSWKPGGIEKIAQTLIDRWPARLVTPSMAELGCERDRIYTAEEVRMVRSEIPVTPTGRTGRRDDDFLLQGELSPSERRADRARELLDDCENHVAEAAAEGAARPTSYPASDFVEKCRRTAEQELARFILERLCLDPSVCFDGKTLWYFPRLIETLTELHDLETGAALDQAPVTEIGGKVEETLEYALAERCLVVVDGVARIGKTFAVKAWCDAHPGGARYVQVPSSNDEISFFRALCDALGLGAGLAYKLNELRAKVENVLQCGDLLLVLDEGHYLWPQRNIRNAKIPPRINWVLTQLVNMGVPVAIVTTPQFTKHQEAIVRNGGWSSEQLVGRIMHYERLPDSLGEEDLEAVARHWMPAGDVKAIRLLVTYAQSSEKYLQGIEALVRRGRFLARNLGREQPTFADLAAAFREGVVPSDKALAVTLKPSQTPAGKRAKRAAKAELKQPFRTPESGLLPTPAAAFVLPTQDTGNAVLSS